MRIRKENAPRKEASIYHLHLHAGVVLILSGEKDFVLLLVLSRKQITGVMSVSIYHISAAFQVFERSDLQSRDKLVLIALCDCINAETLQCNPSYSYLQKKLGLSRPTISKALKALTDTGLITIKKKGNSLTQESSEYLINLVNDLNYPSKEMEGASKEMGQNLVARVYSNQNLTRKNRGFKKQEDQNTGGHASFKTYKPGY